jgi:hypothetical protein
MEEHVIAELDGEVRRGWVIEVGLKEGLKRYDG